MEELKQDYFSFKSSVLERLEKIESKLLKCKPVDDLETMDKQVRYIMDKMVRKMTLRETAKYVQASFVKSSDEDQFLRSAFKYVLLKDKNYRKILGNLINCLINEDVISSRNLVDVLTSLLIVDDTFVNYGHRLWENLTDIILPVVAENHVDLLTVKQVAQIALEGDNYKQFIQHFAFAVETCGKCNALNVDVLHIKEEGAGLEDVYKLEDVLGDYEDVLYDYADQEAAAGDTFQKIKTKISQMIGYQLLNNYADMEICVAEIRKMCQTLGKDIILDQILETAFQKQRTHRKAAANLVIGLLIDNVVCLADFVYALRGHLKKFDEYMKNKFTARHVCSGVYDLVDPLCKHGYMTSEQFFDAARMVLSGEAFSTLQKYGDLPQTSSQPPIYKVNTLSSSDVRINDLRLPPTRTGNVVPNYAATMQGVPPHVKVVNDAPLLPQMISEASMYNQQGRVTTVALDQAKTHRVNQTQSTRKNSTGMEIGKSAVAEVPEQPQHISSPSHVETAQQNASAGDAGPSSEVTAPPKTDPESLPSTVIKEKLVSIVEEMMASGDLKAAARVITNTISRFQMDLMFKAAIDYCKNKPREYRIKFGYLGAELIGIYGEPLKGHILNTISMEVGDVTDTSDFWYGLAEIVGPLIVQGKFSFTDLKKLPKCFLQTTYCGNLLMAIFDTIQIEKDAEWLRNAWLQSQLSLEDFIPLSSVYNYITTYDILFCVPDEDDVQFYKENSK